MQTRVQCIDVWWEKSFSIFVICNKSVAFHFIPLPLWLKKRNARQKKKDFLLNVIYISICNGIRVSFRNRCTMYLKERNKITADETAMSESLSISQFPWPNNEIELIEMEIEKWAWENINGNFSDWVQF